MLSDAAAYVTDKITHTATERLAAAIVWMAVVGIFAAGAVALALVAGYLYLAPIYGSLEAATLLAGGCFMVALLAWVMPRLIRKASRMEDRHEAQPYGAMRAVDEGASDVVDYFGAAKVMATAFMFGFSAARRIRS